jgi:uncharacterized protein (DUF2252 family)
MSHSERRTAGRALRERVPRESHADWDLGARNDPIDVLEAQAATRLPELVPLRYGRMAASPFAFLRGAAAVMAMDLALTPVTGVSVQCCGDAHVSNFGEFATPERNIIFDLNDFDETFPGPWEWDVKRLAASLAVVCRQQGFAKSSATAVVRAAVAAYRGRLATYAELRVLDLWYERITAAEVTAHFPPEYRPLVRRDLSKARRRTHLRAVEKLTVGTGHRRRFVEDPPVLVHFGRTEHDLDEIDGVIDGYRRSLPDDTRAVFDRFRLLDVARKVVGVGSVGTRCWVGLFEGPGHPGGDPVVLQLKEAPPSVLEPYLGAPAEHNGQRVVSGQRLTQAASDLFLGWSSGPRSGRHYYARQLWDVKGQGDPMAMDTRNLAHYGELCAWALARAHARTGEPAVVSGYLGKKDDFDRAIAEFAQRYADQTERDHQALVHAIAEGRVEALVDRER